MQQDNKTTLLQHGKSEASGVNIHFPDFPKRTGSLAYVGVAYPSEPVRFAISGKPRFTHTPTPSISRKKKKNARWKTN
jgi:hypothetical protein